MESKTSFMSCSELLDHDVSKWIVGKIDKLQGRARFCSYNAVRFLHWADDIFETSHLVASYCAMNATEEAVAAFISSAKENGHKSSGAKVNLHAHPNKAMVSIFAQRCTIIANKAKLAIQVHKPTDSLAFRVPKGEGYHYGHLHLSTFQIGTSGSNEIDNGIMLGDMPSLEDIENEAQLTHQKRNSLLYATDSGVSSGFIRPDYEIARNTALSLGLIWAAVDMYMHPEQDRPLIEEILPHLVPTPRLRSPS